MTALKEQFLALLTAFAVENTVAHNLWQNLQSHYNEPHRHYHNLSHIKALHSHFDSVKPFLKNPHAVELAIFYHDVIYDPKQSDNEMQSVKFLQNQLAEFLPKSLLNEVGGLILATQKHTLTDVENSDMAYFLDMDLAILGSEKAVYQNYAQAIRQEYAHFADNDYRQGRSAVLKAFLQRPKLFFSQVFFDKYENVARQNIQAEIYQLNQ